MPDPSPSVHELRGSPPVPATGSVLFTTTTTRGELE
jgi:hypothetical protein